MKFDDDFAMALPRRRDDEPPELRAQIVKELRDHLACAYQRELLRTGDEAQATKRVQEQFGDPRQLVRKLWFAAMQEKIMSQRILIGLSALLAIACVGMGGFALRIAQQTAAASAAASKTLVEQSRETNLALLRALERLAPVAARPTSAEPQVNSTAESEVDTPTTGEISLKLVKGHPGGPAAAGYQICVLRGSGLGMFRSNIDGVSDENGEFAAAVVNPESYDVRVTAPWDEVASFKFEVSAGPAEPREIVCPESPPAEASLTFDVQWPDHLRNENLGLLIRCVEKRLVDGVTWSSAAMQDDESAGVVVTPDGIILHGNFGRWGSRNELPKIKFHVASAVPRNTLPCKGTDCRLYVIGVVIPVSDSADSDEYLLIETLRVEADGVDPAEVSFQSVPGRTDPHVSIPIMPELAAGVHRALGRPFNPAGTVGHNLVSKTRDGKPDQEDIDKQIESIASDIGHWSLVVGHDAMTATFYGNRSNLWRQKGEFAKAVGDLSEAIRLQPGDYSYRCDRGSVWNEMREFDNALDDYAAAIDMYPQAQMAYERRVEIWEKQGQLKNAIAEYSKLIENVPGDDDLYIARGHLSQKNHSLADAFQDYIEALACAPKSASTNANMAWFLATAADPKYRNAKRSLKLAVEACRLANWRDWDALNALAAAYAESGDFELAAAWQSKCLEMAKAAVFDRTDEDVKLAEARLAEYKAGKPWRSAE
jgi:tetratricopeptide (TPR) repeat protein